MSSKNLPELQPLSFEALKSRLERLGIKPVDLMAWLDEHHRTYYRWRHGTPIPLWMTCVLLTLERAHDLPEDLTPDVLEVTTLPALEPAEVPSALVEFSSRHPLLTLHTVDEVSNILASYPWSLPFDREIITLLQQLLGSCPEDDLEMQSVLLPPHLWPDIKAVQALTHTSHVTISNHLRGKTKKKLLYIGVKLSGHGWRVSPLSPALVLLSDDTH